MKPEPRLGPLLLVAAALVSFPFFLMIAGVLIAVGQWIHDASGRGEVLIAVILGTIGVAIPAAMLLVERHAIRGRHPGLAGAVGGLCLWLAGVGLIGWFEGFLRVVGVLPIDHDWGSWWELLIYSLFLLMLVFIGTQHLAWRRRLGPLPRRDTSG